MQDILLSAFSDELEKIAERSEAGDRRIRRRYMVGAASAAGGLAIGYGSTRMIVPAILKSLGRDPILSKRVKAIVAATTGLTGAALIHAVGAYANERPPRATRELRSSRAIQPSDRQLAQRYEGYTDPLPARPVLPDAQRSRELPLRARPREGIYRRGEHRTPDFGRRKSEYGFRGKQTRDYNF